MTDQPEPFDLRSHDVAEDKREELLRLFPEARTEDRKIDFDRLKRALGETVDPGRERYGMVWPGKADCFKTIQQPSVGTLLPAREESVDFDTTENLIIEGDNLEVLKLLQKSYLGKVKMIYIDPPYNLGNDFIYPDDYAESLQTYLAYTGQVDAEGRKFSTNTEADGRFHSKWMNMMYPRLYLARNLLRDDGVLFVSIDDHELPNLRRLCDEVLGEENFIVCLPTVMNLKGNQDAYGFADTHEYALVYARSREACKLGSFDIDELELELWSEDEWGLYKKADTLRRTGQDASRESRPKGWFPVFVTPDDQVYVTDDDQQRSADDVILWPVNDEGEELSWTWGKAKITEEPHNLIVVDGRNGKNIYKKQRPQLGDLPTKKPKSLFYKPEYSTSTATNDLKSLMGEKLFDGPKPVPFLVDLCKIGSDAESVVLDFFAGSGTTAHAVLALNKQDGGFRKFILVQLPEPCNPDSAAAKAGYKTIADICKERVRRVIKKLNDEDAGKLPLDGDNKPDRGFRVFKLAGSNFKTWNADLPQGDVAALEEQLAMHIDHLIADRTAEDRLYELLLKSGFPPTTAVEALTLAGKTVHSVQEGQMLICLDKELSFEAIKAMAYMKPERVVCLDEGFAGNDQLKTNAVQTMKGKNIVFRTV